MATMPSTLANHLTYTPKPAEPRRKLISGNRGLTQAYEFRDIAATEALSLKDAPAVTLQERLSRAQGLCALVKAWAEASDRIRILRGKPLPGSLRPQSKPTKRKQISSAPSEQPSSSLPTVGSSSDSMPSKE